MTYGVIFLSTNQDVQKYATAVGSALIKQNLVPTVTDSQGITIRPVGVYSKNRAEWSIVDIACQLYGLTSTAFYDTLGPASISYGMKTTQCLYEII
jgi:long-chain acyl-CoA synthetase